MLSPSSARDRLHGSDRDFPVSMMISINPNIQQQFRNPAKEPGLKVIVFHKVHLFLQRKGTGNRKEQ